MFSNKNICSNIFGAAFLSILLFEINILLLLLKSGNNKWRRRGRRLTLRTMVIILGWGGGDFVTGEFGEHLDDFPHPGTFHAVFLNAKHGDEKQMHGFVFRDDYCSPCQPRIHYPAYFLSSAIRGVLGPLYDVHPIPEFPHRTPPGDQLQEHHSVAVHVALLVHSQCVGIFCISCTFINMYSRDKCNKTKISSIHSKWIACWKTF